MNPYGQGGGSRTERSWLTAGRFTLLAAAFLFALFPQVWLGTHSFFQRDYGVLGYPFLYYGRESFWRGELPLWNPLSNCGAPFMAQWGTMTFYPFSLLYVLLPLPWSLSVFCFGHLLLAGVGMYKLAERWVNHPLASAVAGTAFVFNGFTLACLMWPNYTVALGWMPWVVLATERAWKHGGTQVLVASVVAALQLFSGVPEVVLLTWVIVFAFWLLEMRSPTTSAMAGPDPGSEASQAKAMGDPPAERTPSSRPGRGSLVLRLGTVILLAGGLTAIQLLPFFDLLAHSQRESGTLPVKWAMPAWGWANLFVPLFHCFETPQGQFFQYGQAFLSSYYLGLGVLALAGWACWRVRAGRVWVLAGIGLGGLILALGDHTPLYSWFRSVMPVAALVRYPVKFVTLAAFVVPLLAAYGVRALSLAAASAGGSSRSPASPWPALLRMAGGTALVVGLLLWAARQNLYPYDQWGVTFHNALYRLAFLGGGLTFMGLAVSQRARPSWGPRLAGLVVLLLLVWDAATHTPQQNPVLPTSALQPGLWERAFEYAPPRLGQSRLMISWQAEQALLYSTIKEQEKNFTTKRLAEWSNLNLLDGLPKVNGSSTLQLKEQMQVQAMLYAVTNRPLDGLMDFLGVSRQSAPGKVVEWALRTNALPLVTAGQKPVFVEGTNALAAMAAESFNPRETVLLPHEIRGQVVATNRVRARVEPGRVSPQRFEFVVDAEESAWVVIAQSFYHPWEAEVDGSPVALWRANHAFQALEVPGGRHRVVVTYRDRNLRAGAAASVATLLGLGLFWRRQRGLRPTVA